MGTTGLTTATCPVATTTLTTLSGSACWLSRSVLCCMWSGSGATSSQAHSGPCPASATGYHRMRRRTCSPRSRQTTVALLYLFQSVKQLHDSLFQHKHNYKGIDIVPGVHEDCPSSSFLVNDAFSVTKEKFARFMLPGRQAADK